MPYYCYRCKQCNIEIEVEQKMTDAPLSLCPECQKESLIKIVPSSVGIAFKGQGFYKTDSRKTEQPKKDNAINNEEVFGL